MRVVYGYLPLKRPHLYSGTLLSAEEFTAEQNYLRERQCRHNRFLHGWGIVSGLEVKLDQNDFVVSPGMALDCAGNEIEVPTQLILDSPPCSDCLYIYLRYLEKEVAGGIYFEEGFEIGYEEENRLMTHLRNGPRWETCGGSHPIPIARLRNLKGEWKLDRRYFKPPRAF